MSNHEHERALELIMRRGSEELAVRDLEWLNTHLATCSGCAAYAEDFDQTGHLLRAVAVTASPSLVSRTQQRVRARALHFEMVPPLRQVLIAISFLLGVLSSATSDGCGGSSADGSPPTSAGRRRWSSLAFWCSWYYRRS